MKKSNFFWFFPAILIVMTLMSCGQLNSLQTAKVLEKGTIAIGGSVMGLRIEEDNIFGGDANSGFLPQGDVFLRYGISERFDMGIKLSTGLNALIDAKFQFVGNQSSAFAMAIGAGFEIQGSNFQEVFVSRFHIPLYLSYHPSERFAIYATPRFALQKVSNDNDTNFPGGSVGLSYDFSPRFTMMLEGSYYVPNTQNVNDNDSSLYLFGVGGKYTFNF